MSTPVLEERQPLRTPLLEGGTGCVHRHGKNLRSNWIRVEQISPRIATVAGPAVL